MTSWMGDRSDFVAVHDKRGGNWSISFKFR